MDSEGGYRHEFTPNLPDFKDGYMASIVRCARCGGNHDDLVFYPLSNPWTEYPLYWSICSTSLEPIIATLTSNMESE